MVNNIGTTSQTLSTNLGGAVTTLTSSDITLITGSLELGCLIFDAAGTLGVITTYTSQNSFTVTTYAISIDIQTILSQSY
jgi:hypothetical protein